MRHRHRVLTIPLATVALVLGAVGSSHAAPADDAYVSTGHEGYGRFNADPDDGSFPGAPGDAIRACDTYADGWGVATYLYINPTSDNDQPDRVVDTRGHNASYCSPWKGGNIPEGTYVQIRVCLVKGSSVRDCTDYSEGAA